MTDEIAMQALPRETWTYVDMDEEPFCARYLAFKARSDARARKRTGA